MSKSKYSHSKNKKYNMSMTNHFMSTDTFVNYAK
jgi:hypothetical protein